MYFVFCIPTGKCVYVHMGAGKSPISYVSEFQREGDYAKIDEMENGLKAGTQQKKVFLIATAEYGLSYRKKTLLNFSN